MFSLQLRPLRRTRWQAPLDTVDDGALQRCCQEQKKVWLVCTVPSIVTLSITNEGESNDYMDKSVKTKRRYDYLIY